MTTLSTATNRGWIDGQIWRPDYYYENGARVRLISPTLGTSFVPVGGSPLLPKLTVNVSIPKEAVQVAPEAQASAPAPGTSETTASFFEQEAIPGVKNSLLVLAAALAGLVLMQKR